MEGGLFERPLALGASSVFTPDFTLPSEWLIERGVFSKRFVDITGIISRHVSSLDELGMARKAIESLKDACHFDASRCAAIVFASSSLSSKDPGLIEYRKNELQGALFDRWPAVSELAEALRLDVNPKIREECAIGINWGCNGFVKGVEILRHMNQQEPLREGQFYLLVTANRLSSRVHFGSPTSGLFGDSATATIIAGNRDSLYEPRFLVRYAHAEARVSEGVGFFMKENPEAWVLGLDGSVSIEPRVCIEMDKDVMSGHAVKFTQAGLRSALEELSVPRHRPGGSMESELSMEALLDESEARSLEQARRLNGILLGHATYAVALGVERGLKTSFVKAPIYRSTAQLGNTSSSAIPNELKRFPDLAGLIACPVTGAGTPGECVLGQGCLVIEGVQDT
jgi:3-oxoacyl-[acyl-carrier-protein] synthase III